MKIAVDMGHTIGGPNYGAVGILKESIETRTLGNLVIKHLENLGHEVVDITVDHASSNADSINKRVNKANASNVDLVISLHFNIGGGAGHGVEAYTYQGKQLDEAIRVVEEISKLGYRNRGVKNGTTPRRLGIVNSTRAKSILVECMFIDNQDDVSRYNADLMAKAIVKGITGQEIDKVTDSIGKGDKVKIKKNGKLAEVKGYLENGTNYVEVRDLFERLGYKVSWDSENQIVVID